MEVVRGVGPQLAEIGVILLMFGVGLHFSAADLMAVRAIAIPGAIGQIAIATAMTSTAIGTILPILRDRGLRLLYDESRRGTSDSRVNFIHPKDARGILVELVEPAADGGH